MDPSLEQLDADARAAAAAAAQAEVARAAAQAEADAREKAEKAAENAATLAGILKAIKDSSDKIDRMELKLDTVTSSLDSLSVRADKTEEKLKKQKDFFSGPGLIDEHKDDLKSLILGTMLENKDQLSMVSADDLGKVTQQLTTTDGRLAKLQSKYDQIQTSASSPQTPVSSEPIEALATIVAGVISKSKTPGSDPPGDTPPPAGAGSMEDNDPNAYSGSSFPRHLIFFEGKAADNDIVFNPQVNPSLQLRLWQEKSVSFPYFEDLLLPWEGYLYGIEFITLYHERAVSYLMETPQYQTEGGRTGELLYTKFSVYELGKTAVAALKMIQDQLLGIRDPNDENLYKYRRDPWKDVRSGRVDYGRYMTRSLHLHNVLSAAIALLKFYRGDETNLTSTNLQFETMMSLARHPSAGNGLLYHVWHQIINLNGVDTSTECREMEIQLDMLTYDISNGHCLLRFILSIRTILDCLKNRIATYNLAARKAVLYDRLLRLHMHQFIIPVVRQRQIEASHSEDAFLSSMLELSTILTNQHSYSLVTQSNPNSGVHELSVIDQTKSFDSYVRYVQEQASRSSYKPGPPPVEWEPRLSQVDTPPRDAHATTGLDDLDPDDADEAAGAFAADGNRRTGRDGKGRQKFRPGPSVNAPSLFDDRVVTADQQYKRDRQSFLKRRSNETATTPGIRDRLKGPLRPGSVPKPSGTGGATAPKGTASAPASREELIQAIRKFKDDLRTIRSKTFKESQFRTMATDDVVKLIKELNQIAHNALTSNRQNSKVKANALHMAHELTQHLIDRAVFITGSYVSDDLDGEELITYLTNTLEGQDDGYFAHVASQDPQSFQSGEESN